MENGDSRPSIGTAAGRRTRKVVYRPADVDSPNYERDLGDPGRYPFTRGIHSDMYRARLWTMRQYAGYATAEESNQRYRYLLAQGTTGLSVAFDLPTQIGLDSDHPLSAGEVGRVGVAVDSIQDMERLFEGIPLQDVSTSMTINATASILLALYLCVASRQDQEWSNLRGTIQNDILKEYIARGTFIYPPETSLRIMTDILAFCCREVPRWNPISISGYHIREAGCTAAQEIAFTLANGETYVEAALAAGLRVDDLGPRLSFFFSAHNDLFEEVAKFRSARRLWARLMRDHFEASEPKACALRFHAQTAGSTLTAQQPDNNLVRVSVQALAAVLGGAQSLHTNAKDEALALPAEEAARTALRTQQVLALESGVPEVVDPLGGSWYVERLTRELEDEAQEYLDTIRSFGGMLRAIESGYVQREIQEAAYDQQKRLESGQEIVVGVNRFQEETQEGIGLLRVDPSVESQQVTRLEKLRQARDSYGVSEALDSVRQAAHGRENLMPPIISAVQASATAGEIAAAMRDVFGEHQEAIVL